MFWSKKVYHHAYITVPTFDYFDQSVSLMAYNVKGTTYGLTSFA